MKPLTTVVRDALADYLQRGLIGAFSDLEVWRQWPEPGEKLPAQAISVLIAGKPTLEKHEPVAWKVTRIAPPLALVNYSYGRATIPLQLDIWSVYEAVRDDLAEAVVDLLNRSPVDTLRVPGSLAHYTNHPGLVLKLAEQFDSPCEYTFDALPTPVESIMAAQTGESRSTLEGNALAYLMKQKQIATMDEITLAINATDYVET